MAGAGHSSTLAIAPPGYEMSPPQCGLVDWRDVSPALTLVIKPYDRCHYHVPPGHTRVTVESGHTSNGYWKRAY